MLGSDEAVSRLQKTEFRIPETAHCFLLTAYFLLFTAIPWTLESLDPYSEGIVI